MRRTILVALCLTVAACAGEAAITEETSDRQDLDPSRGTNEEALIAGCGTETFKGRCSNNSVIWCDYGYFGFQTYRENCSLTGKKCAYDASKGYYACQVTSGDPCQGETYKGRCAGSTLVWCENKHIYRVNCANRCSPNDPYYCKSCYMNWSAGYYDCMY